MGQNIEDLFDQYVESLLSGDEVPDFVQGTPELAATLAPLLQTSELVVRQLRTVEPSPRFRAAAQMRMRGQFFARLARKDARPGLLSLWWQQRWATAMATAMVVCFAGLGVLAASFNALPSGFFYPVKVTSEQARLALATSEYERTQLRIEFTESRLSEMTAMADRGDIETAVLMAGEANHLIMQTAASAVFGMSGNEGGPLVLTPGTSDTTLTPVEMLNADRTESLALLEDLVAAAPDNLKPDIESLMTELSREFDTTITYLETKTAS